MKSDLRKAAEHYTVRGDPMLGLVFDDGLN